MKDNNVNPDMSLDKQFLRRLSAYEPFVLIIHYVTATTQTVFCFKEALSIAVSEDFKVKYDDKSADRDNPDPNYNIYTITDKDNVLGIQQSFTFNAKNIVSIEKHESSDESGFISSDTYIIGLYEPSGRESTPNQSNVNYCFFTFPAKLHIDIPALIKELKDEIID